MAINQPAPCLAPQQRNGAAKGGSFGAPYFGGGGHWAQAVSLETQGLDGGFQNSGLCVWCPAAQAFSGDHRGQLLSSMFRSAFQKSRRWRGWAGGGGIAGEVATALTQAGHGAGT